MAQFPKLAGGSQCTTTAVLLASWATGRAGAAGTPSHEQIQKHQLDNDSYCSIHPFSTSTKDTKKYE